MSYDARHHCQALANVGFLFRIVVVVVVVLAVVFVATVVVEYDIVSVASVVVDVVDVDVSTIQHGHWMVEATCLYLHHCGRWVELEVEVGEFQEQCGRMLPACWREEGLTVVGWNVSSNYFSSHAGHAWRLAAVVLAGT